MSLTTWNGATVPTNSDTYDVPGWLKTAIDTSGIIIPATLAQRDGLEALAPDAVLPVGTTVARTDVTGCPLERWDGSEWRRGQRVQIGQGANDPTHAAGVTVITTNVSGDATITFPVPFGSVLVSANINDANDPTIFGAVLLKLTYGTSDNTKITLRAYTTSGTALASQNIAVAWSADGY
jgi:hypothetical protein